MSPTLLAFGMPGPFEMMIIAGFGLLIFGKRLPEVGKGLARSIVEFKKGLREVTDEIEGAGRPATAAAPMASAPIAPVVQQPIVSPTATPITPPSTTPTP